MVIIIGNIIALAASILMVYSGIIKEKKKVLYVQSIHIGLSVASNIVLGGISGAIINAISFFRNILCYKDKLDLKWKIIITVLSIGLTVYFNNLGIIGLLPLISTVVYLWLMTVKDDTKFKILIIFMMVLWGIYDFTIKSYTSCVFDMFTIVSSIIGIYRIRAGNLKITQSDEDSSHENEERFREYEERK